MEKADSDSERGVMREIVSTKNESDRGRAREDYIKEIIKMGNSSLQVNPSFPY